MKENYFFHSDLKVNLVVVILAILERFTFSLMGLIDVNDSAILIFFEYFSKYLYISKNVSKNKASYKIMLVVHTEKKYQEIIKVNITKVFI